MLLTKQFFLFYLGTGVLFKICTLIMYVNFMVVRMILITAEFIENNFEIFSENSKFLPPKKRSGGEEQFFRENSTSPFVGF